MPLQLTYRSSLNIFALSSTDGAAAAELAVQADRRITGSGTNVNKIQWVATGDTAAELPLTLVLTGTTPAGSLTPAPTYGRPIGGSGTATLNGVHAIEVKVSADATTSAEAEGAGPVDRTFTGYLELKNADEDVLWRYAFEVSEPGDIIVGAWTARSGIPNAELTVYIDASSIRSRIEILTIADG